MTKRSITSCPLCGGTDMTPKCTCTDYYVSGEQFDILSCHTCGFTFTQDVNVGDDIDRYYNNPQYISHSDTKKGLINRLYHLVRKIMLKRKVALVSRVYQHRAGKLLDIGTGTGYFPAMMRDKQWTVDAIEKNESARQFAHTRFGLDVMDERGLDRLQNGTYDVVTLWHVMEHLEDLNHIWERLYQLLNEKGILVVAVPNIASYDAEKYGAEWAAYDVPRHLWHFTSGTIQRLGAKHGFILAERHPMPFDAFYISMLSEKNMKHHFAFMRGMYIGLLAWFQTLAHKERSSSMIYVFRKKRHEKQ